MSRIKLILLGSMNTFDTYNYSHECFDILKGCYSNFVISFKWWRRWCKLTTDTYVTC